MTATVQDDLACAALAYGWNGLSVFPVSRAKHPLTSHGRNDATTNDGTISTWWRRWPCANVAATTGRDAGFIVLDIDPRHGGNDALDALQTRNASIPPTLTCRTGGGGLHLYFRHPGGEVRTTQSKIGAGLDILGERASVILPPSVHASGARYSWLDVSVPIAAAPAWFVELVRSGPPPSSPPRPVRAISASTSYGRRALDDEAARVRRATEGTRNRTLNAAAFNLGQLVAASVLEYNNVTTVLLDAALSCGLSEREAAATIASGVRAGNAMPRRMELRR
jgi:hypothetical protein